MFQNKYEPSIKLLLTIMDKRRNERYGIESITKIEKESINSKAMEKKGRRAHYKKNEVT